MNEKIENFLKEVSLQSNSDQQILRTLLYKLMNTGFIAEAGKNNSYIHIKTQSGTNYGCFTKTGRFRNYGSRLTGESYLDELGGLLGVDIYKKGSDHFWTVTDGKMKSICISSLLPFYRDWIELLRKEVSKN